MKNIFEGPAGYWSSASLRAADINLIFPKQWLTGSSSIWMMDCELGPSNWGKQLKGLTFLDSRDDSLRIPQFPVKVERNLNKLGVLSLRGAGDVVSPGL